MMPVTVTRPMSGDENVIVRALPSSVADASGVVSSVVISPVSASGVPVSVNVPDCVPPGVATSKSHVPRAWTTASGSAPAGPSSSSMSVRTPSTNT